MNDGIVKSDKLRRPQLIQSSIRTYSANQPTIVAFITDIPDFSCMIVDMYKGTKNTSTPYSVTAFAACRRPLRRKGIRDWTESWRRPGIRNPQRRYLVLRI